MFKKMMMLFLMGFSISVFADENLMGGDRVGNGGDVVVCGKKVELLDIYEARLNKYEIDRPVGSNYKEMFKSLISKKLMVLQPKRMNRYLQHLETFESEAQFLPGIQLNDIDDAGMVAIPKGCILKQIAIQLSDEDRPAGKKRYTVSLDLWNKLDEFNKMSLILHEIIYREAIEYETSNSLVVRAFVGEILKNKIDLNIFMSLSAALSRRIEYKQHLWVLEKNNKPTINFYKNKYEEDILIIESIGMLYSYQGSLLKMPAVEVRLADGKILDGGEFFKFLRANETVHFIISSGRTLVNVTSNTNLDYAFGRFVGLKDSDITFQYLGEAEFTVSIQKANDLSWGEYYFSGSFYLKYQDLIFSDKENADIVFSYNGDIKRFNLKSSTSRVVLAGSSFNCQAYSNGIETTTEYTFRNCIPEGTNFKMTIARKDVDFQLAEETDLIMLDRYYQSIALLNNAVLQTASKFYLGLKAGTSEQIYLEAGKYKIYKNGLTFNIENDKVKYHLDRDGEVVDDREPSI